jgi:hypothetical protein
MVFAQVDVMVVPSALFHGGHVSIQHILSVLRLTV